MISEKSYLPSFIKRSRLNQSSKTILKCDLFESFVLSAEKIHEVALQSCKWQKINLEIGFGDGIHIVKRALNDPQSLYIGCEVYLNGIANVLKAIKEHTIKNIFLFNNDARVMLRSLPDRFLYKIYILFPDPWPKRKHHKRRLISLDFVDLLSSKITDSGSIIIATDHFGYAEHIDEVLKHAGLIYDIKKPVDWIATKYQLKSKRQNNAFDCFTICSQKSEF